MMLILSILALILCCVLAGGQFVFGWRFARMIRQTSRCADPSVEFPKAAVVLALRGPDPFLDQCIKRLMCQEYDDYHVFIVVDSENDPVQQQLTQILSKPGSERVSVSVLQQRFDTCSLKCSSLVHAIQQIDNSFEVVGFIDGDATPHPHWLRDLVTPLLDHQIGVTYGNRWYVPSAFQWGTWVRYCWNVGAVVQVWLNDIIWAGSMAMRMETIKGVELVDAWQKALSVDATVHRQMRKHGLAIQFVPGVMILNHEQVPLPKFLGWMQRQMIASKSTGNWSLIGAHAANIALTQTLSMTLLVAAVLTGNVLSALLTGIGLAIYLALSMIGLLDIETSIRKIVRLKNEPVRWNMFHATAMLVPAVVLTQIIYPVIVCIAVLRRKISWRGIQYQIRGNEDVQLMNYQPFRGYSNVTNHESVI